MDTTNDELSLARERLAKDIIGEIVLADHAGKAIRKWRNIFKISQKQIATELKMSSSVISDYESGRRKSPGIGTVKKYVQTLLKIDVDGGGNIIRSFGKTTQTTVLSKAILDIKEFGQGMTVGDFCRAIKATLLTKPEDAKTELYGYTLVDSVKAITELSYNELIKLYGLTSQRAVVFTQVSTGRTPMVAIKLTNLHPSLVVLHGLNSVDDVAKRIAEVENIPLALCTMEKVEDIIGALKKLG